MDAPAPVITLYFVNINRDNVYLIFYLSVLIIKVSRLSKIGGIDLKENVSRVMQK